MELLAEANMGAKFVITLGERKSKPSQR